jgi:CRISPR-associated protein Cas2
MIVLILEKVPASLRGELSRWAIEPRTGVFVGNVSAMVRDKLWEKVCAKVRGGSAVLIYPYPNEQGFAIQTYGDPSRSLVYWEGLRLVCIPKKEE